MRMKLAAILWKDLHRELRSKEAVQAGVVLVLLFFVLDLFTFTNLSNAPQAATAALWAPILYGSAALSARSLASETDRGTLDLLRGAPVPLPFVPLVAGARVRMAMTNKLVRLKNSVEKAWARVAVQRQRRDDRIPNLVETVKGYAAHEKGVLEGVTAARAAAINAQGPADKAQAENVLSSALKSLFAVSEAYPDLKANQNFLSLQEEITGSEDKVAYARQFYNDTVRGYNTSIATFPTAMIAKQFGFAAREYYEAGDDARGAVQVKF